MGGFPVNYYTGKRICRGNMNPGFTNLVQTMSVLPQSERVASPRGRLPMNQFRCALFFCGSAEAQPEKQVAQQHAMPCFRGAFTSGPLGIDKRRILIKHAGSLLVRLSLQDHTLPMRERSANGLCEIL